MPDDLDKVFKAYDVRGVYPSPLNEEVARRIGAGAGQFLLSHRPGAHGAAGAAGDRPVPGQIVVGRDMRLSSPALLAALVDGLTTAGADCIDIGMIDTPQIYFAINYLNACGGVQTTASHNPAQYNGFKISGERARPVGEETGLREIKTLAAQTPAAATAKGAVERQSVAAAYKTHVLQFLKLNKPLKVAVDASNGMAGQFIPNIFQGVKNLEIIPLNMAITGAFKHEPNPLVDANLQELQEAVISHGADLGVCFDGDADRCIFVDEQARIVRCDIVTALLARHFLKNNPGDAIVYDLRSSRVVKEEIENAGGVPRRQRVGHSFMKKTLAESRGVFGGELSGHFYFRDNFNCDSGAIAFSCLLSVLSGYDLPMSQVLRPLLRWHDSGEINYEVADKEAAIARLATRYKDAAIDYLDGITVEYDTWWFNVRQSNTEPLLRLNLEANTADLLKRKVEEVGGQLGTPVAH